MQTQTRDPFSWGFWSADIADNIADFQKGENIARECLSAGAGEGPRVLLAQVIADMRDRGRFEEIEAGFVSLLARKSLFGAKPFDLNSYVDPIGLGEEDREDFLRGMKAAIADMATREAIDRLLPRRIMARVESAVLGSECSSEFAGYITAVISAATACCAH